MISKVSPTSCCAPLIPFIEKNEKPIAMTLAALVFLAGAATAGVALAGYLPYHYFYAGVGIIALELVLVGVCLGITYCRQQKNSAHSTEKDRPADEGRIGDTGPSVGSAPSDSESSETSDADSETEVEIKEPGQKIPPTGTFWLPDEVWVRIFGYLDPKDLSSAFLTCKRWNQLVQTDSLWSQWILKQDWHEDKPECFQVWRQIHSIKRATPRKIFHQNLNSTWITNSACSGNHLVYYCCNNKAVHVWKIEKGKLLQRPEVIKGGVPADLGYSNEIVYLLQYNGEVVNCDLETKQFEKWQVGLFKDHIFSNSEKLMTSGNGIIDYWGKKTFQKLDSERLITKKFLVYKNQLIFVSERKDELIMRDLKTRRERILKRENLWYVNFFVSGSILIMQIKGGAPILRYDLDTKKWLDEINPGDGFALVGALGGMIIVKPHLSLDLKIFDFRNQVMTSSKASD